MKEVILDPELWESVEAGDHARLERWLVAEGDHVLAGQAVASAVLVDQTVPVPAGHNGVLEQIVVAAGETFAPGAVLARIIET